MIDSEELNLLAQIISFEYDATKKLEEFYNKRDIENFKKTKVEILNFQKQLSDLIEKWH